MLNRISISQHPFEFVIKQINQILPGIESVKAYYFDERDFRIKSIRFENGETIIENVSDLKLPSIQKQRGLAQKYEWLKNDFELFKSAENIQISIEDSNNQDILCLRFENPVDFLHDLIYIHLNGKIGTLKLSLAEEKIKEDEKSIIERLIYNSVSFVINNERKNKKLYQNVINNVETLKLSNAQLKNEVASKEDSFNKSISYFCKSYVYKIAKEESVSLHITNDAIKKIINDNIPFDKIEPLLRQTIEMCLNRTFDYSENILIDEFDLILPKTSTKKEQTNTVEQAPQINDRYAKTKEYLDRYERSAEILLKKGLSLTGANLGAHCSPTISAAAISDNIKKHRSKIITLLNRYQDKWPIIRENYRPINKLIDNSDLNQLKNAV